MLLLTLLPFVGWADDAGLLKFSVANPSVAPEFRELFYSNGPGISVYGYNGTNWVQVEYGYRFKATENGNWSEWTDGTFPYPLQVGFYEVASIFSSEPGDTNYPDGEDYGTFQVVAPELVIKLNGTKVTETSVNNFPLDVFYGDYDVKNMVTWQVNKGTDNVPDWSAAPSPIQPGDYRAKYDIYNGMEETPEYVYASVTLTEDQGGDPTQGDATTSNDLYVQPQTTCVMFWGQPFALTAKDIIVTPSASATTEVKTAILEKIKINEDLSSQQQALGFKDFTIGLIDPLTDAGRQITVGGTTYTLNISGPGRVDIRKGTNKLVEGWQNGVALAQGLVFNGGAQVLAEAADYTFLSYSAEVDGNAYGEGKVHVNGSKTVQEIVEERYVTVDYTEIKVLSNTPANGVPEAAAASFVGKTFYVKCTPNDVPTGRLQLYTYEKKDGKDVFTPEDIWVNITNTKLTTYAGAYQFFSISAADYQNAFEVAAVTAAQADKGETPLTEEEIAAAKATAITNMPAPKDYVFGKANPVLTETWGEEGVLPTGTNAGTYYVWVQAADGGLMYEGGQIAYVGPTTIAKATPTFAGPITGVEETYYLFTATGNPLNWKNLRTTKDADDKPVPAIVPAGPYSVSIGNWSMPVQPEKDKIRYYVQKGTKVNVNGKDEIHYAWTTDSWSGRTLDNFAGFEEGYYRILALFLGDDNLNPAGLNDGETRVAAEFVVSKPTAIIQTTIKGQNEATYAYGVKPLKGDYSYSVSWPAYEGTLNGPSKEEAPYTWYTKNTDGKYVPAMVDNTGNYTYGTYYILPEVYGENGPVNPFSVSGNDFAEPIVKPAVVFVTATNILAKVENQELVFGQELPLKLKYSQGAYTPNTETGAKLIKEFEDYMWPSGFTATNTETGEEIKLYSQEAYTVTTGGMWGTPRVETKYYRTTILPVGTYTVTANVAKGDEFTVLAAEGTWTVTAKDIDNNDFGDWQDPHDADDTPEPRVKGMGGTFKLSKTYTSKEITLYELGENSEGNVIPTRNDLDGKFTYRKGLVGIAIELGQEPTPAQIEEFNKQRGFYYGSLVPGIDFEITSYTNNINAGTATFHVKGIGNFTGEKDLTFTIDKAPIFVFPDKYNGVNKWAVGSPQEDAFQVDWNGKKEIPELTYKGVTYKDVPTGIKYQLHAFENDRQKDMTGEEGFKALKVKFIVGATVGVYDAGLEAYAENDEKAKNYEFVFQTAPLTIEQGTIVLAVADITADDVNAVTYQGTTRPRENNAAGKFVLAPADKQVQPLDPALQQQWWKVATDKDEDGNPWAITWKDNLDDYRVTVDASKEIYRYPASAALGEGEAYTITCTTFPEGAMSSTNYKFVLAEGANVGALTVKQAEATIAVVGNVANAEVPTVEKSYGDFIALAEGDTEHRSAEYFKNDFIAHIGDLNWGNGVALGFKYPYFEVTGEQKGDNELTDLYNGATVNAKSEIIITEPENLNYNFTLTNGILVIGASNEVLALTSEAVEYYKDQYGDYTDGVATEGFPYGHDVDEEHKVVKNGGDLAKIKAYDLVPVKAVTIKLKAAALDPANEAYSQWKAYEWHAMVLPFATTVGEVAYNFGYAVVNVVDEEATAASTKPNEVKFKLQEMEDEIPANTPFLIKSQYDFDFDKTLKFGDVDGSLAKAQQDLKPILIKYDPNPSVAAGRGITFDGTYDQKVFNNTTTNYKFLGPDSKWKRYNASSTSTYTMQPYTSYLNLGGFTGTREVVVIVEEEDGSTTAINAAELQKKSTEGLYRVDGVKLQSAPTQKGVYIQDGKKFVK